MKSAAYFDYCLRIWDFPKPTIAQVQGACVSGGFMMPTCVTWWWLPSPPISPTLLVTRWALPPPKC